MNCKYVVNLVTSYIEYTNHQSYNIITHTAFGKVFSSHDNKIFYYMIAYKC